MADDPNLTLAPTPDASPPPTPAVPETIADRTARAIDIAASRAADREAGKEVPDLMSTLTIPVKRDSTGKFAPQPKPSPDREPAPAPDVKAAPAAQDAPKPDATVAATAADAAQALQPNPRWSEADKASFARLPREAQQSILDMRERHDADYTRKTQDVAAQLKRVEPLVAAYGEHSEFLDHYAQQTGSNPARIMGDMAQLLRQGTTGADHERAQAAGFVLRLFRIDPRAFVNGAAQGQPQQAVDVPEPVMRELHQLRQEAAAQRQFRQEIERQNQQQAETGALRYIQAFRDAKDEQGQLKHPHFDAVKELVAHHAEAGRSLEEAYALAAQPITDAITARVTQEQQARQASEAQARTAAEASERERTAQVERARRAGGPRPAASRPGLTQAQTISDRTTEAMRRAGMEV